MGMRDRDGRQAAVAVPTRRNAFDLADPGAPRAYLIGDVAALTGLTPHTLRAWERLDLLAPRRSAGGVRQYSEEDIAFARLIARTLDARRLPRRAVAALIRSGELRPTPDDYAPHPVRGIQSARTAQAHPRSHGQTNAESEVSPSTPARAASNRPLLDACARLSNAVASGAERQEFCELIVREARTIFGLADAVLWLVEPSELPAPHAGNTSPPQFGALPEAVADGHPTVLGPAAAAGARGLAVQRAALRLPLANTHLLVVQAIHTGREIVLDGLTPSPRAHPELTLLLPAAALLILPLATAAGRAVGALALREALDFKRFDDALSGEARLFATHVAHLIELTRLRDDMSAARARAEAERARWRAIAEYAPEMLVACDATMRISWSDATYERTFGQPVDRISSANAWPSTPRLLLPDESAPFPFEALPLVRALREYRPVHDIEIAHRAPGGAYHLLSWTAAPAQGPRGEVLGAVAIGRDVTDDRRRVARAACLAAVARVAASAPDPAGVAARAARLLEALARHSGVPIVSASLHLLDPDDGSVTRIGEAHAGIVAKPVAEAPASDPLADGDHAIWRALATGAQYSDTGFPDMGLPDSGRAVPSVVEQHAPSWWESAGVQARAIVPLRAGPLLLGALDVAVARPVHWDAGERTWLETCADIMAVALERDRLSAAARRATDELEAIVEGADAGITLVAADGGILRRNAAAAALTGADDDPNALSDSLGPYAPRDPATGAPMPAEARPIARALRGEVVRDALVLTRDSGGRDRLTQTSCTPVRDAGGAVVAAVNYERDATDHMRRTRLYAHLGQALGAILEPGETMRALADALVSIAGIDTVAIYLASPDGDGLDLLWARNYPLDVLETVRHIAPSAPTITALALRTGQPQVLRNWAQAGTDDHHLTRYLARRLDLGSGAAIPMLARGRVMGVLMAGASQPDGFPPEEVGLLLDLAAHAGLAMDNARLYQAAHRSADEQEAIIAAMADPVWVCDADGRLTSVNQAATLLGSTPPAAPGEPPARGEPASDVSAPRLIWPDGSPVPPGETPLERARRGDGITGLEAIIQRGTGDDVRLMLSAAPIRDETTGAITGAVSVGHDITILRQLEHAREEFLAIASHELKTPLTSLLGFVQAARRKESRRIQSMLVAGTATDAGAGGTSVGSAPAGGAMGPILDAELLERIERQALRLDRLIGDLLDVARIQQGRMQYRWSEGDVAGAVAEAVDEQRAASPDRQIILVLPDEPLMARLDADRLRQVVTNLLTNALKYSRAEQPVVVEVTRAAIVRGGDRDDPGARPAAAVRVRDTGPGIPPDHRERIFERFYRVPGLQVQSGSGIGLGVGLYVAREVVERHGGRIWVESDHPDETTFAFTVPLIAPDRQP